MTFGSTAGVGRTRSRKNGMACSGFFASSQTARCVREVAGPARLLFIHNFICRLAVFHLSGTRFAPFAVFKFAQYSMERRDVRGNW